MARTIFTVLFWIWGSLGLLLNTGAYLGLHGNVGVGTSAYVALGMFYWLGGMVLLGGGAILSTKRVATPPSSTAFDK